MKTLMKEKKLFVILPEKEHKKFKTFAASQGISMSELVRKAVNEMSANTIVTHSK